MKYIDTINNSYILCHNLLFFGLYQEFNTNNSYIDKSVCFFRDKQLDEFRNIKFMLSYYISPPEINFQCDSFLSASQNFTSKTFSQVHSRCCNFFRMRKIAFGECKLKN